MRKAVLVAIAATLLTALAQAKDKKPIVPPSFLRARTVVVLIDPTAGISPTDPNANQIAQKDVETALANWGRFETVLSKEGADLVITIRKGSGKLVDTTITDPRQNSRPGSVTPSDDGITVGAQRGTPPGGSPADPFPGTRSDSHPQTEIGGTDDSFIVEDLDGVRWRYDAKDALHHRDVPAVEKFKKVIEDAEKAANTPPKNPPAKPSATPPANAPANPQPNNP
jgi:hypothetical protein